MLFRIELGKAMLPSPIRPITRRVRSHSAIFQRALTELHQTVGRQYERVSKLSIVMPAKPA